MPSSPDRTGQQTWIGGQEPAGRRLVAVQVGQFALAGLIALAIVGLATSIASRRIGQREAITDARTTTVLKAQGVVEPALTDPLLAGDQTAVGRLDTVVRRDVLDGSLVRVKIWTPDGRIVYSDEPRLIGTQYTLGVDERNAIQAGTIEAEVSDLSKPENVFERSYGKLLEVYLPVSTPSGKPLLFESYYRFKAVDVNGARLWRAFAPIALGALVMLELVQIPLAWALARRLRARLREREALLGRALHASEVERRQIASDLHDGAVQDLAGVAYELSAAARTPSLQADTADAVEHSAESIRRSIQSLRSLIVDIYPPDLDDVSFESALDDLTRRAQDRGIEVHVDVSGIRDPLPPSVARLLYRAAQEGLRNVLSHSGASMVAVRVAAAGRMAELDIADNGRGLQGETAEGHVGLTALRGLVGDAGGTLVIESTEPSGARLHVEVPL